ncbi:serine-threonine protein kinase, putative [Entamoeba invadens IP1]|uniref:Serine-threonine protein kinase, putative n=1 Tax=Entamoeba invadens IP1 TaxID=370355 RepID=A0A0A1UA85_ENTIV|nr:serine-threonine protein kinase, putative [Entamoeba invadens IP1]ELP90076.1 serine-threonine protein kinase, putative [Entamoeba invadens IP1]|eukprot:XP_004256847.1 serine-threonine protein kinase, putative [Entamoeba invadens IP1]
MSLSKRKSEVPLTKLTAPTTEVKKSYRKSFIMRSKMLFSTTPSPNNTVLLSTKRDRDKDHSSSNASPRLHSKDEKVSSLIIFGKSLSKLTIQEKTFHQVPLVVHNIIVLLYHKLSHRLDFFQEQTVSCYDFKTSEKLGATYLGDVRKMSIDEIISAGTDLETARKLKKFADVEQPEHFFELLDLNQNCRNYELIKVNKIANEYDMGKLPNLNQVCEIKTGFVLLKKYLLELPNPLLNEGICAKLDQTLSLQCKISQEKLQQIVEEEFKLFVGFGETVVCGQTETFKEIVLFLRFVVDTFFLTQNERDEIYICFFNAMMQSELFNSKYIPLVNILFKNNKCSFELTDLYQYEGEKVIQKFQDVLTAPYFVDTVQLENDELLNGCLYITNYRIVFIPDTLPTLVQKRFLRYSGICSICSVYNVTEDVKEGFKNVRILSKDMKVLTFRMKQNNESVEDLVHVEQKLFEPFNETETIPADDIDYLLNEIVVDNDLNRLQITPESTSHFPTFKPNVVVETEEMFAVTVFQTSENCKLLRFPKGESGYAASTPKGFSPQLPADVSGIFMMSPMDSSDVISKDVNSILETLLSVNDETQNRTFAKKVEDFSKIISRALDFLTKCVKEMKMTNAVVVLLPSSFEDRCVSVFSALTQLVVDKYYRTITGFVVLLQKEFIQFKFFANGDSSAAFFIFLVCLQALIHNNESSFEFDDRLIDFMYTSYNAKRFSEFDGNLYNEKSSFFKMLLFNQHEFKSQFFHNKSGNDKIIIPENGFVFFFDNFINFSRKSYFICKTQSQINSINNTKLSHFEENSLFLNLFVETKELDLSNNFFIEFPLHLCKMTQLIKLDLSMNKLINFTNEISRLTNLTHLSLANNQLTYLPSLEKLPLKYLDISSNNFSRYSQFNFGKDIVDFKGWHLPVYPITLSSDMALTSLDFSYSHFDILDIIANPPRNLLELKITHCGLELIPEEITTLSITRLDVSSNKINKMNYSFFSMTSLKEIDLTANPLKLSILFSTMTGLKVITNNTTSMNIAKSALKTRTPRAFNRTVSLNIVEIAADQTTQKWQELEKVLFVGDDFRKEVFQLINRKLQKKGSITTIASSSFYFEPKDKKKKKVLFEEIPTYTIRTKMWEYHHTCFVVCKNEKLGSDLDEILENIGKLNMKKTVYLITGYTVDEDFLKSYNTKYGMKIAPHKYISEKKKCTSLFAKLIKEIDQKAVEVSEPCLRVLKELDMLKTPESCLDVSMLKNLMDTMKIENGEKVVKTLIGLGMILTTKDQRFDTTLDKLDDNDKLLVDFSFFNTVDDLFSCSRSRVGFLTPKVLETIGVKSSSIEFVIELLEQHGVITLTQRKYARSLGLEGRFDEIEKSFNCQSYPTKEARNSNGSGGSLVSKYTEKRCLISPRDRIETPGILMCTFNNYEDNYNFSAWPKGHQKNETEIGRIYCVKYLTSSVSNELISSFMLKYNVLSYWKKGAILILNSKEKDVKDKIYIMVSAEEGRRQVTVRLRYLLSRRTAYFVMKLQVEIGLFIDTVLRYNSTEVEKVLEMCSECLKNGEIFTTTQRQVKEAVEKFQYRVKVGEHKHTINASVCCLDLIIDTFPRIKMMKMKDLTFVNKIASGSNSTIELYEYVNPLEDNFELHNYVVVKTAKCDVKDIGVDEKSKVEDLYTQFVDDFLHEFFFLNFPESSHLAKVMGFSFDPMFITMEYFDGGSLFDMIHEKQAKFDMKTKLMIAKQIAEGMECLHTFRIPLIHRDLKSPNVLIRLDGAGNFKSCAVSDFGQTVAVNSIRNDNEIECPYWLAQEVICGEPFTQKSDVYSYAIVLWELVTEKFPFKQFNFFSVVREKVKTGYRLPIDVESPLNQLITKCWSVDPDERPTFSAIKADVSMLLNNEC